MMTPTSMFLALFYSITFVAAVPSVSLKPRDVDSIVSSPNASSVWVIGSTQTVVWNIPSLTQDVLGNILLGYGTGGDFQYQTPLAANVDLLLGSWDIVVPSVDPRDQYYTVEIEGPNNFGITSTVFTITDRSSATTDTTTSTDTTAATSTDSATTTTATDSDTTTTLTDSSTTTTLTDSATTTTLTDSDTTTTLTNSDTTTTLTDSATTTTLTDSTDSAASTAWSSSWSSSWSSGASATDTWVSGSTVPTGTADNITVVVSSTTASFGSAHTSVVPLSGNATTTSTTISGTIISTNDATSLMLSSGLTKYIIPLAVFALLV